VPQGFGLILPFSANPFLETQGIALPDLLIEVYLDKYESFMLLEACECSCVEWNFDDVTYHEPGILNIRLTDLSLAEREQNLSETDKFPQSQGQAQQSSQPQYANPTPAGLFSFSMMIGMETVALLGSK
jgi:hypothetical protein